MLNDILKQKGLSIYKVSKETGIPYTTLYDLSVGNTLIECTSSSTLYHLARYLQLSMEEIYHSNDPSSNIYIYNEKSTIYVEFGKHRMQYKGPKNLIAFKKVNRLQHRMVCADTYFQDVDGSVYIEEEYIDLEDIFNDYGMLNELPTNLTIILGKQSTSHKERLMDEALLVSDSMVISYQPSSSGDLNVLVVNLNRTNLRMLVELPSYDILHTNMSEKMQKRAIEAIKRNQTYILEKIKEEVANA